MQNAFQLKRGISFTMILLATFAYAAPAADLYFIVPNSLAGRNGNSQDNNPFGGPWRMQQVYEASQFSAVGTGGGLIKAIEFHPESTFAAGLSNLQVNLSTTAKAPDGLSSAFAQNVGTDDTIVFGPAPMDLNNNQHPAAIYFSTPFYFNPTSGNLLLDIRNFSGDVFGGTGGSLDGELTIGDSVSRIWGEVNGSTGLIVDTFGYATSFLITPVPEPSSFTLLVLGIVPLGVCVWRRKRKRGVR
jgi:hypothetical protein